jgi:hypothetical protein
MNEKSRPSEIGMAFTIIVTDSLAFESTPDLRSPVSDFLGSISIFFLPLSVD